MVAAVAIKCGKCGVKLGTIDNIWLKLGNDRIALITDANTDLEVDFEDLNNDEKFDVTGINNDLALEILLTGDVWKGARGTFVADSKLRDMMCASCSAPLGLQCVEPHVENHALAKNQYIFFVKAIVLKSVKDGRRKIEPEIQQAFSWMDNREQQLGLEHAQTSSPQSSEYDSQEDNANQEQQESEDDVENTDEDVPQEYLLEPEVAAALRSVVSAFERDIKQLYDGLRETRAEVNKLKIENQGLKADLKKANNEAELAHKSAEAANSNFLVFKADIEKLVACLENYNTQQPSLTTVSKLPTRALKRPSIRDHDDSVEHPSKRVAMTPEISAATNRRHPSTGGSQRSSPIVSSASRRNGLLTRPARRSSGLFGGKELNDQEMEGTDHA